MANGLIHGLINGLTDWLPKLMQGWLLTYEGVSDASGERSKPRENGRVVAIGEEPVAPQQRHFDVQPRQQLANARGLVKPAIEAPRSRSRNESVTTHQSGEQASKPKAASEQAREQSAPQLHCMQ